MFATRFDEVGPRLLPPELVASKPFAPAADGRGWKYCAPVKFCASNAEPRIAPDLSTSKLPSAWCGKNNCAAPKTTSGYTPPKMMAKKIVATIERPNSAKRFFINFSEFNLFQT